MTNRLPRPSRAERRLLIAGLAFVPLLAAVERFPGERWWPTLALVYSPQVIWAIPPMLLAVWFARRRRWPHAGAMAVAVAAAFLLLVGVSPPRVRSTESYDIRLMTWNLNHGKGGMAIAEMARTLLPDIICLQEATPWADRSLNEMLHLPLFRGRHYKRCGELIVLSRFPLTRLGTTHSAMWVAADVHGTPVVIVCAHLRTPMTYAAYKKSGFAKALQAANGLRTMQTDQIIDHLSPEARTILCGDLNTPPNCRIYRRLNSRLTDSFAAVGSGIGSTYPTWFPMVRIDHIMVSNGLRAVRCWSPKIRASNHRPLVSDIRIVSR